MNLSSTSPAEGSRNVPRDRQPAPYRPDRPRPRPTGIPVRKSGIPTLTPLSLPRFPLSPGAPPQPVGAGNRHAIFADSYLELLGVVDRNLWDGISKAAKGPFDIDRPLARYKGLHVLHLATNSIEDVHSRREKRTFQPSAIRPFQRSVDTPDGPLTMRARTLSLPAGTMPEALFQIAQHDTPELVLQPRYMHHANGARRLVDVSNLNAWKRSPKPSADTAQSPMHPSDTAVRQPASPWVTPIF